MALSSNHLITYLIDANIHGGIMQSWYKFKRYNYFGLNFIGFLVLWCLAMSLTGCDTPSVFQSKNPKAAAVIENVVDLAEKLGEQEAETVLHLPDGSLQLVFDHKVFNVPAATVTAAQAAGVLSATAEPLVTPASVAASPTK